ncbi:MAG: hypothetical protein QM763_25025 [Agriterribacter sp.]
MKYLSIYWNIYILVKVIITMVIISKTILQTFINEHPGSATALENMTRQTQGKLFIKTGDMKYEINSRKGYHETMIAIYKLMDKGEANLSVSELKKLAEMSVAAEKYEDEVLGLQPKKYLNQLLR